MNIPAKCDDKDSGENKDLFVRFFDKSAKIFYEQFS